MIEMTETRICPICGAEFIPHMHAHVYCSRKCSRKKQLVQQRERRSSTLCWTCSRAYALPDPYGCAFHRRNAQTGEIQGFPFSKASLGERSYNGKQGVTMTIYIVQECPDYRIGSRRGLGGLADREEA